MKKNIKFCFVLIIGLAVLLMMTFYQSLLLEIKNIKNQILIIIMAILISGIVRFNCYVHL